MKRVFKSDAYHGVLSRGVRLAAGGRLGVGNDPRYQKAMCFDPFPFPTPDQVQRDRIAVLAEQIDRHRQEGLRADARVTITGMYNVVAKLRNGERLTATERAVHEAAACGVLRDLDDQLDAAVAQAYGWTWPLNDAEILVRLVDLHDERVEEEQAGTVRWLRPEYQSRQFAGDAPELRLAPAMQQLDAREAELMPWPASTVQQITAIQALLTRTAASADEIAALFRGARREIVTRHLETLALMGEVRIGPDGAYHAMLRSA